MSKQSELKILASLTSSAEGSPVKISPALVKARALLAAAQACGMNMHGLSEGLDQSGSSSKMSPVGRPVGAARWVDEVCSDLGRLGYETLPIPLSAFDVSAPHIRQRVFVIARYANANSTGIEGGGLMLPTPAKRDYKMSGCASEQARHTPSILAQLGATGLLAPPFVEWMMGFPIGWSESKP